MGNPDAAKGIRVVVGLAFLCFEPLLAAQSPIVKQLDRLDWQPTWALPAGRYVGSEVCAQCHTDVAATQTKTAMAHALAAPGTSVVLQEHPRLAFSNGLYRYTIERVGNRVTYAVTDGKDTISVPVLWAFGYGVGEVGQTYLLSYKGSYYESQVSYFHGPGALDVTLGHSPEPPPSLQDALGLVLKPGELRACFGCHSTRSVSDGRLQIESLIPGITCEGCHGPGGRHVAAIEAGGMQDAKIFDPATLEPGDQVKFCGACHRTQAHAKAFGINGILTVRFQPYRLTESRCFNPRDRRISCLACHDPHLNRRSTSASYDSKCLACHASAKEARRSPEHSAPACPVSGSRCVTCHMPKYSLAGSHYKFTDHRIRVVRLGDAFD